MWRSRHPARRRRPPGGRLAKVRSWGVAHVFYACCQLVCRHCIALLVVRLLSQLLSQADCLAPCLCCAQPGLAQLRLPRAATRLPHSTTAAQPSGHQHHHHLGGYALGWAWLICCYCRLWNKCVGHCLCVWGGVGGWVSVCGGWGGRAAAAAAAAGRRGGLSKLPTYACHTTCRHLHHCAAAGGGGGQRCRAGVWSRTLASSAGPAERQQRRSQQTCWAAGRRGGRGGGAAERASAGAAGGRVRPARHIPGGGQRCSKARHWRSR